MAIDEKAPSEKRPIAFHLGPQIPAGASITSVQAYVSRKAAGFTTTLTAPASAESSTLTLAADPGKGALLIVNPGSPTAEETFKVTSMAGLVATLSHSTEQAFSGGATVNYEPGWTTRLLVTDVPANVGTDVTLWSQFGADGQTYRISVLAILNNGTVVEEERDLVVTEHAPLATKTIQVDVVADIEFGFDDPVGLSGTDILNGSGVAWASREVSVGTTLAASVVQGAASIQLTANPGVGAFLTLNPTGTKQEKLKVTTVTGTGPFVCVTNPTPDFDHANAEPLTFEPGVSTRFLGSATPTVTIVGATKAIVRKQKGMAKQTYRVTTLVSLQGANAERVQGSMHVAVVEE
jgi:hypothetical protein